MQRKGDDPSARAAETVVAHLRRTIERDGGRHPSSVVREFSAHVERTASEGPLDFDLLLERCIETLHASEAPQELCIEICVAAEAAKNAWLHRASFAADDDVAPEAAP